MHAGCNEREIKDFSTSPNVTAALRHPDCSTVPDIEVQNGFVD